MIGKQVFGWNIVLALTLLPHCAKHTASPESGVIVSGVVQLGRVRGATIEVYAIRNGERAEFLGMGQTDENGGYQVNLSPVDVPVEVVSKGGAYVDEATGKEVGLFSQDEMSVVFEDLVSSKVGPITPITTQVKEKVFSSLKNHSEKSFRELKQEALSVVAKIWGIDATTIIALPSDPKSPGDPSSNEGKAAFILATFSQFMKDHGLTHELGVSVGDVISKLAKSIAKEGKVNLGDSYGIDSGEWTSGMTAAIGNFKNGLGKEVFKAFDASMFASFAGNPDAETTTVSVISPGATPSSSPTVSLLRAYRPTPTNCGNTGFGSTGTITLPSINGENPIVSALVLDSECRTIVGGPVGSRDPVLDFWVGRILPTGELDISFGTNGLTRTDMSTYGDGADMVRTMALAPGGKILAGGYRDSGRFGLAKYLSTGLLDLIFGIAGKLNREEAFVSSIGSYEDGRFLISGSGGLKRFYSDGTLDLSYGTNGTVTGGSVATQALILQSDGKSIAGMTKAGSSICTLIVQRRNTDGALDTSFGTSGQAEISFNTLLSCSVYSLAMRGDGKIMLGGNKGFSSLLARFNSDGTLDATFGTLGGVTTTLVEVPHGLLVQPDGKVIIGGSVSLARFNTDGNPDTSFGGAETGKVNLITTIEHNSLALQPDGKILVGLYSAGSVRRYKTNGLIDSP